MRLCHYDSLHYTHLISISYKYLHENPGRKVSATFAFSSNSRSLLFGTMHVPLELFRIMLDYVIINSKLEPIFKLRLVSRKSTDLPPHLL